MTRLAEAERSLRELGIDQVDLYLVHWQHGVRVITTSTHRERIEENAHVFDFVLSRADMAARDSLDEIGGTDRALERTWW